LRHLIVGIDAGKTAAVACLDLDGRVVKVATGRFVGLDWFVKTIKDAGTPVMITGDKRRPTPMIGKLTAIFDAVLFVPGSDLSVEKKRLIASEQFDNLHERDAIAAAKVAYNAYASKLRQAARQARESGSDAEHVKAMVVKEYSVHEAISKKRAGRRFVRRRQE
jgi:uncharacterized protein